MILEPFVNLLLSPFFPQLIFLKLFFKNPKYKDQYGPHDDQLEPNYTRFEALARNTPTGYSFTLIRMVYNNNLQFISNFYNLF